MFRPRYLAIRSTVTRENLLCLITVVLVLLSGSSGYRQEALVGYSEKQNDQIFLVTAHGTIRVTLLEAFAPECCRLVLQLAKKGCKACRFYRNELPPEVGEGPPYGLLQGSLDGMTDIPPREETVTAKRGHVCMIPGSNEFFIAAIDHKEWGTAHTVWGVVKNMSIVDALLHQPFHTITHPTYGTIMRMMDDEEGFDIGIQEHDLSM